MGLIKTDKELERLIHTLAQDIVYARIHLKLHLDLIEAIQEFEWEMNQAPTFWKLTIQSHLDAALIRLCRVFDKNQNALSLVNLLGIIKQNLEMFDTEGFRERMKGNPFVDSLSQDHKKPDPLVLEEDITNMSSNTPLTKKLIMWRNNLLAHRTAKLVVRQKDWALENPLTISELEELSSQASTILNRYSSMFSASVHSSTIVGHDDYMDVLNRVKSDLMRE